MTKERKLWTLLGASENRKLHAKELHLPSVAELRNFVPGRDGYPALRDDFGLNTETLEAVTALGTILVDDDTDFLNSIVDTQDTQRAYFSRFLPYQSVNGSVTLKCATLTTATVSGTAADKTLTFSGVDCMRDLWVGVLVAITGDSVYRIASITSTTVVELDTALAKTAAGTACTIYLVHDSVPAAWPLHVEQWGNRLVYQSEQPCPPVVHAGIGGPFENVTSSGMNFSTWADLAVSNYKPAACNGTYWLFLQSLTPYGVYCAANPTGSKTNCSGLPSNPSCCCYAENLGKWVVIGYGGGAGFDTIYESADGTPASFSLKSTGAGGVVCATFVDAGSLLVIVGGYGGIGTIAHATSITGTWTEVDITGSTSLQDGCYDGTNIIVVANGVWTSPDAVDWTNRGSVSFKKVKATSTLAVAVGWGTGAYSGDHGATWTTSIDIAKSNYHWNDLYLVGTKFVASGYDTNATRGIVAYSTNGADWTFVDLGAQGAACGTLGIYQALTESDTFTHLALRPSSGSVWRVGTKATGTAEEFGNFSVVSRSYRSKTFAVAGGYLMLGGTMEWDDASSSWVYHSRRWRWASPGTTNDFEGEGASFMDCPGAGDILCGIGVGTSVLSFESTGLAILEQRGDLDAPWGYRRLKAGVLPISNPCNLGDKVAWIGVDGLLWMTNGTQVQQVGDFDLSQWDDWELGAGPVWLSYYPTLGCLAVFRPLTSGTPKVWLISDDGRVSYITLPLWSVSGYGMRPQSVFVSQTGDEQKLYVGYQPTPVNAVGTITMSGSAVANETFVVGTRTFTWVVQRSTAGEVTIGVDAANSCGGIVIAVNADLTSVTSVVDGDTVVVTATTPGPAGNSIVFTEASTNMAMNGSGHLGGTTSGGYAAPPALYLQKGQYITGFDAIPASGTVPWFARLRTGQERLTQEGSLTSLSDVEIWAFSGYTGLTTTSTDLEATISLRTKTIDTDWVANGETTGTAVAMNTSVNGTGTAWSALIQLADNATLRVELPCLAAAARFYTKSGSTYTSFADYTITEDREITLGHALSNDLYAFWDGHPLVIVSEGDHVYVESIESLSEVDEVRSATMIEARPGTGTGTSHAAVLIPGLKMTAGDDYTVHGVGKRLDAVELEINVLPSGNAAAPSSVRLTGLMLSHTTLEAEELRRR